MKYIRRLLKLGIIIILPVMVLSSLPPSLATAYPQFIDTYPTHGPVGTTVSIQGESFTPSTANSSGIATTTLAKTYFPDKTTLVKTTSIDTEGNFETYLVIGAAPAGKQLIWVYDESASPPAWNSTTFTVESQITLSQTSGYAGDNITINGTGFASSSNITIYFDSLQIASTITSQNGSFTGANITIPATSNGSHSFRAIDANNNQHSTEFIARQRLTVSPTSGFIGDEITVSGTGFAASEDITVTFNNKIIATSPASIQTSSTGNFTGKFYVPASAANIYITAVSDGTNQADTVFVVVFGGRLNRTIGQIGDNVTYTGAGFMPGRVAAVFYDAIPVAEAIVNTEGNLEANFNIPASSSGNHTVSVTDGTNSTKHTFILVQVARGDVNPNAGSAGSEITFTGAGFIPGRIATISRDTILVTEAIIDAEGNFTATFKAPTSSSGEQSISATDGINTVDLIFTIESTAPPTPLLLSPANESSAKPRNYVAWESVTDISGVTYTLQIAADTNFSSDNSSSLLLEKSRLTASEYTLTSEDNLESGLSYYWRVRAVDNASNTGNWSAIQEIYFDSSELMLSPESAEPLKSDKPAKSSWFLFSVVLEGGAFLGLFGLWYTKKKKG